MFRNDWEPEGLPRSKVRTSNKLNPITTPGPKFEPGSHWWKASVRTTAPSLLSLVVAGRKPNQRWAIGLLRMPRTMSKSREAVITMDFRSISLEYTQWDGNAIEMIYITMKLRGCSSKISCFIDSCLCRANHMFCLRKPLCKHKLRTISV